MPRLNPNDPKGYSWLIISDFTAGIQMNSLQGLHFNPMMATRSDKPAANQFGYALQTFGCIGYPGGGLGSLPGPASSISLGTTVNALNGTPVWINGFFNYPTNDSVGVKDNFYYVYSYRCNNAGNPWESELRGVNYLGATDQPLIQLGGNGTYQVVNFNPHYPYMAMLTDLSAPEGVTPFIFFSSFSVNDLSTDGRIASYNVRTGAVNIYSPNQHRTGFLFPHQARNIFLEINSVQFPGDTFSLVNFSDPPQTDTMGYQYEIFGSGYLASYAAWGSISSGELLLLKAFGGGIIVSSDIFAPYITEVHGVQSPGLLYQKAANTPLGLAYCASNQGAWIWDGGLTSQKISGQLNDNFYDWQNIFGPATVESVGIEYWNGLIIFTGGWVFDTQTGAWWQLYAPGSVGGLQGEAFHIVPSADGKGFWTIPVQFTAGVNYQINKWSVDTPNALWEWSSQPIVIGNGEEVDVEKIVLKASGAGAITIRIVDILGVDDYSESINFDAVGTGSTQALVMDLPLTAFAQISTLMLDIQVQPTVNKPVIIHSVAIAYKTRYQIAPLV